MTALSITTPFLGPFSKCKLFLNKPISEAEGWSTGNANKGQNQLLSDRPSSSVQLSKTSKVSNVTANEQIKMRQQLAS
jgi:hypothetical protein